jgi:hypothetical protein
MVTGINDALEAGPKKWKDQYSSSSKIINEVYKLALGRVPEEEELKVALKLLGPAPEMARLEIFCGLLCCYQNFN